MNEPGQKDPELARANALFAAWSVGLAPLVAALSLAWLLFGRFRWSVNATFLVIASSILLGAFGGLGQWIVQKNPWWLLATVASIGLGWFTLELLKAMAMAQMH